jgi:hypothetical protein
MKRKGMLISTMVFSIGGLLVDQVFLKDSDGPLASASASDLMAMGSGKMPPAPPKPAGPPVQALLSGLGGGTMDLGAALDPGGGGIVDAFRSPAWNSPNAAASGEPVTAAPTSITSARLTAIMMSPNRSAAVIDGVVVRVGQTRGGVRLIAVDHRSATVEINGQQTTLHLNR